MTPCLQSRRTKTLKALFGVAYTKNWRNLRSLVVPKLYRVGPVSKQKRRVSRKETNGIKMDGKHYDQERSNIHPWTCVIQRPKANFTFQCLRYPFHCQFLAIFLTVKKIKFE